MSEIRRKLLIQGSGISDYVQDGLLLNLDGTNKGGVPRHWIDTVAGYDFSSGSGAVELANGFSFNKYTSNAYMCMNQYLPFSNSDPSNFTLECVFSCGFSDNQWGPLFTLGNTDYVGAGMGISTYKSVYGSEDMAIYFNYRKNNSYKIPLNGKQLLTISLKFKDKTYFRNAIKYTSSSSTTGSHGHEYYPAIGGRCAGGYNWDLDGRFTGTIHAIRVYNRKLTDKEIIQNLLLDILKYNITV